MLTIRLSASEKPKNQMIHTLNLLALVVY